MQQLPIRQPGTEMAEEVTATGTLVIPTVLDYPGSVVVYDVKGEIFDKTVGNRTLAGNVCLKFSPTEEQSVRWNSLEEVRRGTIRDVSDVRNLAEMLCYPNGEKCKDRDSYWPDSCWDDMAASLAAGVILHEGYKARRQGRRAALRDVALALSPFAWSFDEYLNEMTSFEHDPNAECGWTLPDGRRVKTHPAVQEKAREMLDKINKDGFDDEFEGALATAKKRFALFHDPLISRNTGSSDFLVDNLVNHERPVTLYLTVPADDEKRLTPLLRLMLTTIIYRQTERVFNLNRHKLLFLIPRFLLPIGWNYEDCSSIETVFC